MKEANGPQHSAAEQYRLHQAEELLKAAGYVEQADGTWKKAANSDSRNGSAQR